MVIAMNRVLVIVIALISCDLSSTLQASSISFMDMFDKTPFFDGRSLSGEFLTEPFTVPQINEDKKSVFDAEDRLAEMLKAASLNSVGAIKEFAYLKNMAAQGNTYALSFFCDLFQSGKLFGHELPSFHEQPERAEFFDTIREFSIDWKAAQTKETKSAILGRINSIVKQAKLFDFIHRLKLDDPESFNQVISDVIEILVFNFGKNKQELADKFGVSRSSIYRTFNKQTLGRKASSPTTIWEAFRSHPLTLQALLELTEEQYSQFIDELDLRSSHTQPRSPIDATGLRRRNVAACIHERDSCQ
jgi:hypothetical protein